MNDLLLILGKRFRELRGARGWSQEEFAHLSGLHRTYIGQIERGEKNISFENLAKVAGVLGVTLSELFAGVDGGAPLEQSNRKPESAGQGAATAARHMIDIQKLTRRLKLQSAAMDRTATLLGELVEVDSQTRVRHRIIRKSRPKS